MITQTRLGAPLLQALQRLLAVLLSSAGGQDLVLHNPVAMGALLKALDPEADPYGPVFASVSQPARSALFQPFFQTSTVVSGPATGRSSLLPYKQSKAIPVTCDLKEGSDKF